MIFTWKAIIIRINQQCRPATHERDIEAKSNIYIDRDNLRTHVIYSHATPWSRNVEELKV